MTLDQVYFCVKGQLTRIEKIIDKHLIKLFFFKKIIDVKW